MHAKMMKSMKGEDGEAQLVCWGKKATGETVADHAIGWFILFIYFFILFYFILFFLFVWCVWCQVKVWARTDLALVSKAITVTCILDCVWPSYSLLTLNGSPIGQP